MNKTGRAKGFESAEALRQSGVPAADQERQIGGKASGNGDSAQSDRSSDDREERIRHRAYRYWEEGGRPEGQADENWHRAAQDLDREDAELQRTRAGRAEDAGRDRS